MGKAKSIVSSLNPFAEPDTPEIDIPASTADQPNQAAETPEAYDTARDRALKAKARQNRKKLIIPLADGQGAGNGLQVK